MQRHLSVVFLASLLMLVGCATAPKQPGIPVSIDLAQLDRWHARGRLGGRGGRTGLLEDEVAVGQAGDALDALGGGVPLEGVHLLQGVGVQVEEPLGLDGAGEADDDATTGALLGVHGDHELGLLDDADLGELRGAAAEEQELRGAGLAAAGDAVRVAGERAEHQRLFHVLGTGGPLSLLAQARQIRLPVVAIGGIDADNGGALMKAGADLLAVLGGVFETADPPAAARAFLPLFATN